MNEVLENIIGKLEAEKFCYFLTIANTGDKSSDADYGKLAEVIDKAIEIVKQEAELNSGSEVSDIKKIYKYVKTLINPYGNPFAGTAYELGLKIMDYIENMTDALDNSVEYTGWIPCSEKMPPVETEVFIVAKRKYSGGKVRYITTTAMYEDGTVLENDSCWRWEEIEGEWDEENDCYIIPEGWWENRHYNPDEVYNNAVDDEVIAWQPLPDQYIEQEEDHGQQA